LKTKDLVKVQQGALTKLAPNIRKGMQSKLQQTDTANKTAAVVSQPSKDSVTAVWFVGTCPECQTDFDTILFKTGRQQRLFCSDACRQAAYRKSPAHRACLDGFKNQRLNRRNTQVSRKNRDKAFSLDRYSGPVVDGVPSVGMLDLKKFPKEFDSSCRSES
jgi:hypothetical protein